MCVCVWGGITCVEMPQRTETSPGITSARAKCPTKSCQRLQGHNPFRSAKSLQSLISRLQIGFMQRNPREKSCWETRQGAGERQEKDLRDNLQFLFSQEARRQRRAQRAPWHLTAQTSLALCLKVHLQDPHSTAAREPRPQLLEEGLEHSRLCTKGSG